MSEPSQSTLVGRTGPPWRFPVDGSKVWEFARAVREDHRAGPDLPVPPTFPAYGLSAFETLSASAEAGLDMRRVLHAEEEYEYLRPLKIGDVLICQTRIVEDYRREGRRGGALRFLVTETEMRDERNGELVVRTRTTMAETDRAGQK